MSCSYWLKSPIFLHIDYITNPIICKSEVHAFFVKIATVDKTLPDAPRKIRVKMDGWFLHKINHLFLRFGGFLHKINRAICVIIAYTFIVEATVLSWERKILS